MNALEHQPGNSQIPAKPWRMTPQAAFWDQNLADHDVEELAVISNDLLELSAAVHHMQKSGRAIKILTVPTERVAATAEVFRRIGVEGVVRDPMGIVVIPVSIAG